VLLKNVCILKKKCKKCSEINKNLLQKGGNYEDIPAGKEIIIYFINEIENKINKLLKKFIFS